MGLTAAWHSRTGASAGSIGSAITTAVFGGSSDASATAVSDPITQGADSISRYFVIRFTADGTGSNTASNILIKRSDATGSGANIDGQSTVIHADAGVAYSQNSTTALTGGTDLQASGANSEGLTAPAAISGTNTGDSQQFAVQVQTGATAVAGQDFILQCTFDVTVA